MCVYAVIKPRTSRGSRAQRDDSEVIEQDEVEQNEEPEGLPSPGFHTEPAEAVPSHIVSPLLEPEPTYTQHQNVYHQHESSLTFPTAAEPVAAEASPPAMPSNSVDYIPPSATISETALSNFTYPPPVAQEAPVSYPDTLEAPMRESQQTQPGASSHQRSGSRRTLPSGQPAHAHAVTGDTTSSQVNNWQALQSSSVSADSSNNLSPAQSKAQPLVPSAPPRAYDDMHQSSGWSAAAQTASQNTSSTAYTSSSQTDAQTVRTKSRVGNRTQSRIHVPNQPGSQEVLVQGNQGLAAPSSYASSTGASNGAQVSIYDYSQYSSARQEPATTQVAYKPYSHHQAAPAVANSYSSYDNYNARSTDAALPPASSSIPQTLASSYSAATATAAAVATAPSTAQWGTSTPSAQSQTAQPYNRSQSASTGVSYNLSSASNHHSQALQGLNMRPQPPSESSLSNAYGQQTQQPQQSHQHQQGYGAYPNNAHAGGSQHQHQQQLQQQQQQNWYGFGADHSSTSSGYPSTTGNGGTHHAHGGNGSYSQSHHRSMNLSSHTYSSIDGGEQAIFDMLRNG